MSTPASRSAPVAPGFGGSDGSVVHETVVPSGCVTTVVVDMLSAGLVAVAAAVAAGARRRGPRNSGSKLPEGTYPYMYLNLV
eukprot:SAG31_NODE_2793_length_5083_cov_5.043339_5_plen_82_part_00